MPPIARLRLFGSFSLEYLGEPVMIPSQRLQSLLAYLALSREESVPRQRLAFLLWPDSSESQAHTNLRTLLHRLHAVMPGIDSLLHLDAQMIGWRPSATLWLDVADFEEALRQAETAKETGDEALMIDSLERAATCC